MFITREPISITDFLSEKIDASCGASVTFSGIVRNYHEGKIVTRLFYECYESMANKQIARIIDRVRQEIQVNSIRLIHRVGSLEIGDLAIVIVVNASHRDEAYRASRSVIDRVKETVPIWKKEFYSDGTHAWTSCQAHESLIP